MLRNFGKWNGYSDTAVDHAEQVAFLKLAPQLPSPDILDRPNALVGIHYLLTDLKGHYGVPQ